jgi:transposase-like protein
VSRICAGLDAEVAAFRGRGLGELACPYLWLDATYLRVREGGHVVSMAALVAVGVASNGERRVLGLELSAGNDEGSAWPRFVRSLVERGLHGVRLVISDDHPGLVKAVREQLLGSGWQRCRVHFTRNAQDLVPRSARSLVASAIRPVFERPDEQTAREQVGRVINGLRPRFPSVAELLADAEPDLLTHFSFPETHRSRIRSTNPLERLNKEIQAPDQGGRDLPDPGLRAAPGRDDPRRAGRRVAGRPLLLPTGVDGADRRARPDRGGGPAAHARELIRSGARKTRC